MFKKIILLTSFFFMQGCFLLIPSPDINFSNCIAVKVTVVSSGAPVNGFSEITFVNSSSREYTAAKIGNDDCYYLFNIPEGEYTLKSGRIDFNDQYTTHITHAFNAENRKAEIQRNQFVFIGNYRIDVFMEKVNVQGSILGGSDRIRPYQIKGEKIDYSADAKRKYYQQAMKDFSGSKWIPLIEKAAK